MELKELLRKAFEAGEIYSGNIEFGEYAETFNDWYENNVVKNNVALGDVRLSLQLLKVARCVNEGCDQNGTITCRDNEGDIYPAPCQWCDERKKLLSNEA